MTAHVVYSAIDPAAPATTSAKVVSDIVRGEIGFDGLLISDDTSMKALSGDFPDKAAAILAAGCDIVLHCNGVMEEMRGIVSKTGPLTGKSLESARARADLHQGARHGRRRPTSATSSRPISKRWRDRGKHEWQKRAKPKPGKPAPMDRLWAENDDSRATGEPSLVVDVAGFEGPLDLLLHLARNQKVDLARISIVALVDQYLKFVESVRAMRLELAADYLVMAAWLAYLKSKLLIPKHPDDDGESGEEMAAVLQFRLKRLEAMRDAAARLVNRNRLGRDIFQRGMPEAVILEKRNDILGDAL